MNPEHGDPRYNRRIPCIGVAIAVAARSAFLIAQSLTMEDGTNGSGLFEALEPVLTEEGVFAECSST